ncbi:MAG: SAM-dependent methyltransferase [Spirochaetota bacterium]
MNRLILKELRALGSQSKERPSVLDLGCGVGGSMIYLSQEVEADYHGVTISSVQARLARAFVAERGLSGISIDEADYTDRRYWERAGDRRYDLAIAVESFLHVDGLLTRLPLIASRLRPGGTLVVVDDMISRLGASESRTRRQTRWLGEFRKGWYAHGLTEMQRFVASARDAGLTLIEARDLTPFLELDRPRDVLVRPIVSALRWLPVRPQWFNNLLGGNALQLALRSHLLGYYFLVFSARSTRRPK